MILFPQIGSMKIILAFPSTDAGRERAMFTISASREGMFGNHS